MTKKHEKNEIETTYDEEHIVESTKKRNWNDFLKNRKGIKRGGKKIGIDLGTANTIVYSDGKVLLREPSVVALYTDTGEILAAGEDAKQMIGRTPGNIIAMHPLKNGVIADFDITCAMIQYYIKKGCGKGRLSNVDVNICAPYGVTDVEKNAIRESVGRLGVKNVTLIEEPLAAAIGAGLPVSEPLGCMIVDIGGGTTETAVISLGGIVVGVSTRIGGDVLDESIMAYIKKEYNLLIGEKTAETLKIKIGTVDEKRKDELEIRGRDLITGLPASKVITSKEVFEAIRANISEMIQDIKITLEKAPPELASDIISNGITLTGGGALLNGLPKLIEKEALVPVKIAPNPLDCVAIGTGLSLSAEKKEV